VNKTGTPGTPGAAAPGGLARFSWGPPESFLGMLPDAAVPLARAPVVVLPVPYEATAPYRSGTRLGPRALLHASRFVEPYDHEADAEPYRVGVHTLPELRLPASDPEAALRELGECIDALLTQDKFVVLLGGEHSIAAPAILAHARRLGRRALSVLQLDAHADLRAEYDGTPYSHACAMYRVHEHAHLVPVGIRALGREEGELMRARHIQPIYGHDLADNTWIDRALGALGPDVYVTIDLDYFDPAVMPATGTPEPGGGTWHATVQLLERVFRERHVVGCDVVELAPIPGLVHPDILAAKLVYKLIGFHAAARTHRTDPQSLG
jgi:N1-aminopropylagmatine ureohydrolase